MMFAQFSILLTLLFTVQYSNKVDTTEAFRACFSSEEFTEFVIEKPFQQDCKQLIVCDNEFISAEDSLTFKGEPIDFQSSGEIFANTIPKTVVYIKELKTEDKTLTITFRMEKYTDDPNHENTVLVKPMWFKVHLVKKNGVWSVELIEQ